MNRSFKMFLRVSIISTCLIIAGLLVYFLVGRSVEKLIYADLNYAIVSGQNKIASTSVVKIPDGSADASAATDNAASTTDATTDDGSGSKSGKTADNSTISKDDWSEPAMGEQYAVLTCESIDLDVPVYYGDSDEILTKGAGQSAHSAFPGQGQTVLIGGHDTTFFAPLEKLNEGDEIILTATYGTYTYKVSKRSIIEGSEIDLKTKEEKLILYTCYPFGEIMKDRSKKIIFECALVDGPSIGGGENE